MIRTLSRHKLLIGATTLAVAASGGAAYAATQTGGTSQQALINDVAKRLNVSPGQLTAAVKAALIDRLQAEVKAGQLTQAQANRLEQRINQNAGLPLILGPGGPGRHMLRAGLRGGLAAAASYLGLTNQQLIGTLRSGKSLAQIAVARGKSTSGLEQAIISAETTRLNRALSSGRITKAEEQRLLSRLSTRVDRLVNRTGWGRPIGPPPFGPPPQNGLLLAPGPGGPGGAPGAGGPPGPGGPPPGV